MYINGNKFTPRRFSSGELKLLVEDLEIKGENADIIYDNDNISLFELLIIIRYYIYNNIKVNLTLAYLPYQRMDHNNGYELETIKYVAQILNDLKLESLTICEPHCSLEYFNNAKRVSLVEPLFKIATKNLEHYTLFFTDKGSFKRYGHLSEKSAYANKTRNKQTGLIESYNIVGDFSGSQNIVIVDDIVSTGDTIVNAVEQLIKQTNCNIYIVCGHFEQNINNNRLFKIKNIKSIYSSDSLTKKSINNKLQLYSVKELIYERN